MEYTLSGIRAALGVAKKDCLFHQPDAPVRHLLFDSRQLSQPDSTLFFAMRNGRVDGHLFIKTLFEKGVRCFVAEPSFRAEAEKLTGANFFFCEKPLGFLQKLAIFHRNQFEIPVVGITGSNGKTVVKEWLFQLLNADFNIVRSPKSWNSQIGVPMSVWQMGVANDLAIFEAGISQKGEMAVLEKIIRPTVGIFTHLGAAHDAGFSGQKEKFLEKFQLFKDAETVICSIDDDVVFENLPKIRAENELAHFITWSKNGRRGADFLVKNIKKTPSGSTLFQLKSTVFDLEPEIYSIPFSDDASLENALHCWCFLFDLGYREEQIAERLRGLEPVEQRLQILPAINRSTLINDSWSNDLDSLRIALNFTERQKFSTRKTLIISDLLQSGMPAGQLYKEVARLVLGKNFTKIIGIGEEVLALKNELPADFDAHFFKNTDAFLGQIQRQDFSEELILLKGARPFLFEKIARRLEQKAHQTVLEVNLAALAHNLQVHARLLAPGVRICVMVKAAGYGSGAIEVARLLEFHRVDYLAVAYPDEGIELREAGIRLPILVLNAEPSSWEAMLRFDLEPEIFSIEMLEKYSEFAQNQADGERKFPIHLKLDTGMRRLGFEEKDLPELIKILKKKPSLDVRSVFSHLAASDSPKHDAFTREQGLLFKKMSGEISKTLKINALRHILNTGGIGRWPEFQFDMARLGIGLYGIGTQNLPAGSEPLRAVNTLKASISQIKEIAPGESVGYNRMGRADHPMRIATISIGYADGLLRAAGNGRFSVLIHGNLAPTVGNICMDMTMVDVTEIPSAQSGDEVIVFGESHPVELLAAVLGTIPYEIFTSISGRVKRVYFFE